jgi:hypothetical protein
MSTENTAKTQQAPLGQAAKGGGETKLSQAGQEAFAMMRSTNKNAAHAAEQVDRLAEHFLGGQPVPRARQAKTVVTLLQQIARDQAVAVELLEKVLNRLPPIVAETAGVT